MLKKRIFIGLLFLFASQFAFSESYLFEAGTYYLLDGRVNVRSEPNLSGKVIGQLDINSKIDVIECAFNEQIINDVSAYWYKIKYGNSNGYIWGGLIAKETFIYKDRDGVNYILHYRVSKVENGKNLINRNTDTFIYINGKHILSKFIWDRNEIPENLEIWNVCYMHTIFDGPHGPTDGVGYTFCIIDNNFNSHNHHVADFTFYIDRHGNIETCGGSYNYLYWEQKR